MAEILDKDAVRLGRAIQVRRTELGVKRPELARRAELSYPYVSEIENGTKTPSAKALGQLAQALELSAAELMMRAEGVEDAGAASGPTSHPAVAEMGRQHRLFRNTDTLMDAPAASPMRYQTPPLRAEMADQRLEELVKAIVRAELAGWARSELPALVRAELDRSADNADGGVSSIQSDRKQTLHVEEVVRDLKTIIEQLSQASGLPAGTSDDDS